MKKFIKNCLATTGLTMLLLAFIASIYDARFIFVAGVFQSGLVNVVIHAGYLLIRRLESQYALVEITVDIAWILMVVLTAGHIFHWYESTPAPVLAGLCFSIYIGSSLLGILRIRSDVKEINKQLELRREGRTTCE